jgi:hypothetical protein
MPYLIDPPQPLMSLLVHGFVLFAYESRVNITRSPAIRNIARHITEGAGLLAGRTSLGHGIGSERVTTI